MESGHSSSDTERAEIVFRDGDGYEIGRMRLEDQEESEPHFLPDSISVEFRSLRPETNREESDAGGKQYADPDEPTCKYCGRAAEKVVPAGAPYFQCSTHGRLDDSEVLGINPGEIPKWERVA